MRTHLQLIIVVVVAVMIPTCANCGKDEQADGGTEAELKDCVSCKLILCRGCMDRFNAGGDCNTCPFCTQNLGDKTTPRYRGRSSNEVPQSKCFLFRSWSRLSARLGGHSIGSSGRVQSQCA